MSTTACSSAYTINVAATMPMRRRLLSTSTSTAALNTPSSQAAVIRASSGVSGQNQSGATEAGAIKSPNPATPVSNVITA